MLFYHYIAGLKRAGFRILNLLLLQPDNSSEAALAEYADKLVQPGTFEILPCRADRFIVSGRCSSRLNTAPLEEALRQAEVFQPDAVFCLDLLSAWVAGRVSSGAKLTWLGDLNFQTVWYRAWYAMQEHPVRAIDLPSAWLHCRAWKAIYKQVLRTMDAVIVSSHSSQEHLRRLGIAATYAPYPWPAQPSADEGSPEPRPTKPTFLFFGTLPALGSRSAFHFMVRALYPRLRRAWGRQGFQVLIAGTLGLPAWVDKALIQRPEFRYLGFVGDLDRVMASCHAVLAPIEVPVGNRTRIVTAMAKGVPVIAHRSAALGNPDLVNGVTCYLATDAERFVECMRRAVDRPDEVERIVANARERYHARFHPAIATDVVVHALASIINQKRACASQDGAASVESLGRAQAQLMTSGHRAALRSSSS